MRRRRGGAGERIALAALLLGCASAKPQATEVAVRAETPLGEPLHDAVRRLEPGVIAPLGVVVSTEPPPPRVPRHAIRAFPLRARVPAQVSLVLGERVLETRAATGEGDVVFKVDPREILRALPTVRVRLAARPEDVAATGPVLVSAARWDAPYGSRLLDARGGSCEIRQAVPGEGLLVVSGPYALATKRIDVEGTSDIDVEIPLVRPAAVSGCVAVPPMTDPSCDVYAVPLDLGLPPPPLGFAARTPTDADGKFDFGSGPRGRQVILARKRGFGIGWAEVDNTRGPVPDVRIALRPGVQVTLKTAHEGLDAPYVQVDSEDGVPLFARLLVFERRRAPELWLAEGRYVLRHRTFAGEWHARPLTVATEPVVAWIK